MLMTQKRMWYTVNVYGCDSCASAESVFQPNDMDAYALPKGWVELPTKGAHMCPECINGTGKIIEGAAANWPSKEAWAHRQKTRRKDAKSTV